MSERATIHRNGSGGNGGCLRPHSAAGAFSAKGQFGEHPPGVARLCNAMAGVRERIQYVFVTSGAADQWQEIQGERDGAAPMPLYGDPLELREPLAKHSLELGGHGTVDVRQSAATVAIAHVLRPTDERVVRRQTVALEALVGGVNALSAVPAKRFYLVPGERRGLEELHVQARDVGHRETEARRVSVGRHDGALCAHTTGRRVRHDALGGFELGHRRSLEQNRSSGERGASQSPDVFTGVQEASDALEKPPKKDARHRAAASRFVPAPPRASRFRQLHVLLGRPRQTAFRARPQRRCRRVRSHTRYRVHG